MSVKNVVIGIAIIVLTTLVVGFGIQTFYSSPEYNDFCPEVRTLEIIETSEQCGNIGGQWTSEIMKCISEPCLKGYCDRDFKCRNDYSDADETYSRNLFIIAIIMGLILIGVGGALFNLEAVGAGLMGGGITTLLYGAIRYWRFAGDAFRFVLSLIGLIIVIMFAYWLNRRK